MDQLRGFGSLMKIYCLKIEEILKKYNINFNVINLANKF